MNKRNDEADGEYLFLFVLCVSWAALGAFAGYGSGWDAGVRDAAAGRATVISKPDGTTEAVKVKAKEASK